MTENGSKSTDADSTQAREPKFLTAARAIAKETGQSLKAVLDDDVAAMQRSEYPGPQCLSPGEILACSQGNQLPEARQHHLEHCRKCASLLTTIAAAPVPNVAKAVLEIVEVAVSAAPPQVREQIGFAARVNSWLFGAYAALRSPVVQPGLAIAAIAVLAIAAVFVSKEFGGPSIDLLVYADETIDSVTIGQVETAIWVQARPYKKSVVTRLPPDASTNVLGNQLSSNLDVSTLLAIAKPAGYDRIIRLSGVADGDHLVYSADIYSVADGKLTASFQEATVNPWDVSSASYRLAGRIGEYLHQRFTHPTTPSFNHAVTDSLNALILFTRGKQAADYDADDQAAIKLLEQALEVDANFASAHHALGTLLLRNGRPEAGKRSITNAFNLSGDLNDRERYIISATYYDVVEPDVPKAISIYDSLLAQYPNDPVALQNLGILHFSRTKEYGLADRLFTTATRVDPLSPSGYAMAIQARVARNDLDATWTMHAKFAEKLPYSPLVSYYGGGIASAQRDYDRAEAYYSEISDRDTSIVDRDYYMAHIARTRGRTAQSSTYWQRWLNEPRQSTFYYEAAIELAKTLHLRGETEIGVHTVQSVFNDNPPPADTTYLYASLATYLANVGLPELAREALDISESTESRPIGELNIARGAVALAVGNIEQAIQYLENATSERCTICPLPMLGMAYEAVGDWDAAREAYTQFLETPWLERIESDSFWLGPVYRRLAEIHRAENNVSKATEYYSDLITLWENADNAHQMDFVTDAKDYLSTFKERG